MDARILTAAEVVAAMIELTEAGAVVPVWNAECNDIGFWPADQAPPDAEPLSMETVKTHFDRIAPALSAGLN